MVIPVDGVLLVDKPTGPTSHDVVNIIRRLTGIKRIGHSGTLDPLASGLLILCLGRATRLVEYLVGLDKVYLAEIHLGKETETYDGQGQVTRERKVELAVDQVRNALRQFTGDIVQVPPLYSAVKVNGLPLYKHAWKGEPVERPSRQVTVHQINLLAWNPPYLRTEIHCSSGTYIRTIAHDLGQLLGCGAHLSALRRLKIGASHVDAAIPLAHLEKKGLQDHLRSMDSAAAVLPSVVISAEESKKVSSGIQIPKREEPQPEDSTLVRAYNEEGQFIGILETIDNQWKPRKIFYQPEK